ncbi:MAG TPA: alpha/beta hydrolase [Rhodospirillales bacterium]|nr:alpha/beta hydrolase [Rhodospirillales bacterium]
MNNFFTVVGVSYLALVGLLFSFQRNMLYFPDASVPSPVLSGVSEMSPVSLKTSDGLRLLAWYKSASRGRPTLVFFHGNAGNIGGRGFKARPFLDAGYGLLLVEYRGYGGNPGSPSEEGFFADGRAARDFLASQGVSPRLTVLYGESLGTGVAVKMASEMAGESPAGALILEAPYTSIADVAAYHYWYAPVRLLIKDAFDSASLIAGVKSPIFIIHGDSDNTIPTKFGRRLFELAQEPKESLWVPGAGHNEIYAFNGAAAVLDFLKRQTWSIK